MKDYDDLPDSRSSLRLISLGEFVVEAKLRVAAGRLFEFHDAARILNNRDIGIGTGE
jgi:hypothetical protein